MSNMSKQEARVLAAKADLVALLPQLAAGTITSRGVRASVIFNIKARMNAERGKETTTESEAVGVYQPAKARYEAEKTAAMRTAGELGATEQYWIPGLGRNDKLIAAQNAARTAGVVAPVDAGPTQLGPLSDAIKLIAEQNAARAQVEANMKRALVVVTHKPRAEHEQAALDGALNVVSVQ